MSKLFAGRFNGTSIADISPSPEVEDPAGFAACAVEDENNAVAVGFSFINGATWNNMYYWAGDSDWTKEGPAAESVSLAMAWFTPTEGPEPPEPPESPGPDCGYGFGGYGENSEYGWRCASTSDPPDIIPTNPVNGAVDVDPEGPFEFKITDDVGVDSFRVFFQGVEIYDGSAWTEFWGGSSFVSNSENGYDVTLVPATPLPGGKTLTFGCEAYDTDGGSAYRVWLFTVTEEFPWDIWRFLIQSLRDLDRHVNDLFVWRFLRGPQFEWEATYRRIQSLAELNDPELTPADALPYLKWLVGLTSKLDFLTGGLAEEDLRRLISIAARMWKFKGTPKGFVETLEAMSARQVRFLDWFFFRTIIGEMEIGHAELDVDIWLLDQPGMSPAVYPDGLTVFKALDMGVLPSAADPSWVYDPINAGLEGTIFYLYNGALGQDQSSGDAVGGRYYRLDPDASKNPEMGAVWQLRSDPIEVGGHPWFVAFGDGAQEYVLAWSETEVILRTEGGVTVAGPKPYRFTAGNAYRMRVAKTSNGVVASVNGVDLFGNVDPTLFDPDSLGGGYAFGFAEPTENQQWDVLWDDVGPLPVLEFDLSTLLGTEEAVPHRIRVRYLPKNVVRTVFSFWDGSRNLCHVKDGFGLPAPIPTDDLNDYRVGVDPDEFVSDIKVVDDGDLDREMIVNLVKVLRPANERLFVRWLGFQDKFRRPGSWVTVSGSVEEDYDNGQIVLPANATIRTDMNLDLSWKNLVARVQAKMSDVPGYWWEMRFNYVDESNFYSVGMDPGTGERHVFLDKVVGGSRSNLDLHYFPGNFIPNAFYNLMVQTELVPETPGSSLLTTLIKVFLDGNFLFEAYDDELYEGRVAIHNAGQGELTLSLAEVALCPYEFARVGPPPDGPPLNLNTCLERSGAYTYGSMTYGSGTYPPPEIIE